MTVSKSFVYEKLKQNQYQLKIIQRKIKHQPPKQVPINHTWGVDITTLPLSNKQATILGIVEHGSRLNLALKELPSKHSAQILLALCQSIRQYGWSI